MKSRSFLPIAVMILCIFTGCGHAVTEIGTAESSWTTVTDTTATTTEMSVAAAERTTATAPKTQQSLSASTAVTETTAKPTGHTVTAAEQSATTTTATTATKKTIPSMAVSSADTTKTTATSRTTETTQTVTSASRPPVMVTTQKRFSFPTVRWTVATTVPDEPSSEVLCRRVLELVNRERESAGLKPLTYRADLQPAADRRAEEIVTVFSHTRPNGTSCFTAIREQGISYRFAGENIAAGYADADAVMDGWMNSPGHKANILNANFTEMAVGVYFANRRLNWSQLFLG